jgi:excisionase family DNA binding protein
MWLQASIAPSGTRQAKPETSIRRLCMMDDPQQERESEGKQGQSLQTAAQQWLSIRQLQDLLGIGHTKAYELVTTPDGIPNVRIGRVIRVNRRDLYDWLEQRKHRTAN